MESRDLALLVVVMYLSTVIIFGGFFDSPYREPRDACDVMKGMDSPDNCTRCLCQVLLDCRAGNRTRCPCCADTHHWMCREVCEQWPG